MTISPTRSVCYSCQDLYHPDSENKTMMQYKVCDYCAGQIDRGAANREYNRKYTVYNRPHPLRRMLIELFRQLRERFGRPRFPSA